MQNSANGTVYLIPSVIDEEALETIPVYILDAVKKCQVFFVENERTARRFLKKLWREMVIDDYEWHTIHKAEKEVMKAFLNALKQNKTVGILSEAGCPGIADPGQILVDAAQKQSALVKPLVGPSSILLALMASGMNGQLFKFNGYLPIDDLQRTKALKNLEQESQKTGCTQLFIETPYRNLPLLDAIIKNCAPLTRLCIAVSITGVAENIQTKTIADWKNQRPEFNKMPAIFLLSAL